MRLRRLTIRKYRDLAGPVDLEFGRGHVFLLGKNGTGKSTLLELIGRLLAFDLASLRSEPGGVDIEWVVEVFHPEDGQLAASAKATFHSAERAHAVVPDSQGAEPDASPGWTLEVRVDICRPAYRMAVIRESEANWSWQPREAWSPDDPVLPLMIRWASRTTPEVRLGEDLYDKFKEFLELNEFHRIRKKLLFSVINKTSSDLNNNLHIEHINALQAATAPASGGPFDESLLTFDRVVGPDYARFVEVSQISMHGEGIQFLPDRVRTTFFARLRDRASPISAPYTLHPWLLSLLAATAVEAHPRLFQRDAEGQSTYRGFDIYVTWPDGSLHHHSQLSFGQKRLIAFAWYADVAPDAPLLTDELTNGMHAAWVRRIVDVLGDRQAIHALQNPLLLDAVGPGEPDEVRARFILCDVADNPRLWTWRNPTEAEAARIHAAWSTGFQHLSEILESEGLW